MGSFTFNVTASGNASDPNTHDWLDDTLSSSSSTANPIEGHEKRWDREELAPVLDTAAFSAMTRIADHVYLGARVKEYLVDLSNASRTRPDVRIGVSPRGTIALAAAAKAWAAANGRHFVAPDFLAPHTQGKAMRAQRELPLPWVPGAKKSVATKWRP